MTNYSFQDLVDAYKELGLREGDTISLKTGLRSLGAMDAQGKDPLDLHIKALDSVVNLDKGTVVVASTSTNLCDTNIPFSLNRTVGMMGRLTEKIRKTEGAVRSYHAFESYSALGAGANDMFQGLSRHAYGIDTPEDRLLDKDALCVSLGLPVAVTCSIVHHMEMLFGVPYRYVREYQHPIERDDSSIYWDVFYRHPWYKNSDVRKSYSDFLARMTKIGFTFDHLGIGTGFIEAYRLRKYQHYARKVLSRDIYAVLGHEPRVKPWCA